MFTLTAAELKQGGLGAIKRLLSQTKDIIIQERGKDSCVVVDLEYFNQLKLCELEVAYLKSKEDIDKGRFEVVTDVEDHVNKLMLEINKEEKSASQKKVTK